MTFQKNLRYLRKKHNHSQEELASLLGYRSFTTIQKWEDGSSTPPYKTIEKIAKIYQVSIHDIMNRNLEIPSIVPIPIIGTVRGGSPILAEENHIGYENVLVNEQENGDYFYLEVVGDSMMNDRILPGDILYVKRQDSLENGEIGIVLVDDEATVKRVYYKDSQLILKPSNPAYQPMIFSEEEMEKHHIQILGKVIHNKIRY